MSKAVPKKIRRRLCRECRHPFETTNKKRRFCSKLCLSRFTEARRIRDRRVHTKTCGNCGKGFKGGAKTTQYCSRHCSAKHKWQLGLIVVKRGTASPQWMGGHLASVIRRHYGMELDDYHALLKRQNGVCAICKQPPNAQRTRLSVDHDHTTGRVRGLLCSSCNFAIGLMREDPARLRRAMDYLQPETLVSQ